MYFPYPTWLNAGDNSWQLTAATLVGLMSLPGIAILYGGSVKASNAQEILATANVGGALVGGASLKASDFLPIVEAAGR